MARVRWPLLNHQPRIQVTLTLAPSGQSVVRNLLADTGAGTRRARFEPLLDEQDCLHCGGLPAHSVVLGGAYSGSFPVYLLRVQIPALAFDRHVPVVGISHCPAGFEGIACFRFLNRFSYGNFADPGGFALEL